MSKLSGVFEHFKDLDKIPVTDISKWLKTRSSVSYIADYLGNRILYPQTIAASLFDLELDLAILKEAIKRHPEVLYNQSAKKMVIPEEFVGRFPPLKKLVLNLVEALNPPGVTTVCVKGLSATTVVGSIVKPSQFVSQKLVDAKVDGQQVQLKHGIVSRLAVEKHHVNLKIGLADEQIVTGGSLGLIIDLRAK